jgi:hypothetical protein
MTSGSHPSDVYRRVTWLTLALIGVGCMVGIAVPAGLGWDFANFYDAGRRVAAGATSDLYNPLSLIEGQPPQGRTGFFGAPISALLYVPLSGFTPEIALMLFKIQNVLALGATGGILLAFYRPFEGDTPLAEWRFTALFALLFLMYQPFWTVFRVGGQTTATVLLLLTAGLVAHTRGRFWTSAACFVVAVLIKPAIATGALFLACVSGVRYVGRLAALGAGTGFVSVLVMGWPIHAAFLVLMTRSSQLTYPWFFNSAIYLVFDNLRLNLAPGGGGDLRMVLLGLSYALKAAVVLTCVWLALRIRRASGPAAARRHFNYLLAIVFVLLWSPTVWEHYLSLLFPLLIYVLAVRTHFSSPALSLVGLIFVLCLGQNLIVINWLRYGFEFESVPALIGITLFKSGPLLLTLIFLWRHGGELVASHQVSAWARVSTSVRQESA